jgi:hypothetical protein
MGTMVMSLRERLDQWRVEDVLLKYPGLRLTPSRGNNLLLVGELHFCVQGPEHEPIEDAFEVELQIPSNFPAALPLAWERGNRIAWDYHRISSASCFSSGTEGCRTASLPMAMRVFANISRRFSVAVRARGLKDSCVWLPCAADGRTSHIARAGAGVAWAGAIIEK